MNFNVEFENDVFGAEYDCEKARCLLNDLINLFEVEDASNPSREKMLEIRSEFRSIELKLDMVYELVSNVNNALEGMLKTEV